mmetsp:Transcript_14238/g.42763  ORF Transcript_14238/g.42763 Transcript_14238/m.42763 type:complete len:441 (-) Transcript_14238:32-1354(-)
MFCRDEDLLVPHLVVLPGTRLRVDAAVLGKLAHQPCPRQRRPAPALRQHGPRIAGIELVSGARPVLPAARRGAGEPLRVQLGMTDDVVILQRLALWGRLRRVPRRVWPHVARAAAVDSVPPRDARPVVVDALPHRLATPAVHGIPADRFRPRRLGVENYSDVSDELQPGQHIGEVGNAVVVAQHRAYLVGQPRVALETHGAHGAREGPAFVEPYVVRLPVENPKENAAAGERGVVARIGRAMGELAIQPRDESGRSGLRSRVSARFGMRLVSARFGIRLVSARFDMRLVALDVDLELAPAASPQRRGHKSGRSRDHGAGGAEEDEREGRGGGEPFLLFTRAPGTADQRLPLVHGAPARRRLADTRGWLRATSLTHARGTHVHAFRAPSAAPSSRLCGGLRPPTELLRSRNLAAARLGRVLGPASLRAAAREIGRVLKLAC